MSTCIDTWRSRDETENLTGSTQQGLCKLVLQVEPACQHLVDVWAHSCIHPYLNNQIHDTHPISHRDHTLTIATATNMYRDEPIKWLPCPWYHDKDQPGNTPLHVVHPHVCPYCHLELHHGCTCLHPYALCGDWASCDVPSTHLAYAGGCLLISAEHT